MARVHPLLPVACHRCLRMVVPHRFAQVVDQRSVRLCNDCSSVLDSSMAVDDVCAMCMNVLLHTTSRGTAFAGVRMDTQELLTTRITGSLAHRLCRACIRRAFAFPLWSQCQRCAAPGVPLELCVCRRCAKMMCQRCLIHANHDCFTYAVVSAFDARDRLVKTCSSCDCVVTMGGSGSPG